MTGEVLTILLVEDNADHAELVQRNFADNHVANTIRHVKDGEEALDYLFRRGAYSDPDKSPDAEPDPLGSALAEGGRNRGA